MKSINFDYVADIYDNYVKAEFDIPFFLDYAMAAKGKCLELMCGTGRVSIPLINKGIDLTLIDYSEKMLEILKSKIKNLDKPPAIICQDVTKLSLSEKYKLIFIPFNSFSEIITPEGHLSTLVRIRDYLDDEGIFICTLYNPEHRKKTADGAVRAIGKFSLEDGNNLFLSYYNHYDINTQIVSGVQFYEIFDQNKKLIEKRCLDINFYLFDERSFRQLSEKAGLKIINMFGDYKKSAFTKSSMFMNFVLTKS